MGPVRSLKLTLVRRAPHFVQIVRPWRGLLHSPIVVFSMGKVGSTTVHWTVGALPLPNPVFHGHFMSWESIRTRPTCRLGLGPGPSEQHEAAKHLRIFADLTWGLVHWRLITLVRDPVARHVSDLFQNFLDTPQLRGREGNELAEAAIEVLRQRMAAFDEDTDYVCNWFDRQIKSVFEFDILAAPFDAAAGYGRYEARNADILLIRLEDLSERGPEALQAFLDIPHVEILSANEGMAKETRDAYRAVLDRLTLPDSTLDKVYGSRLARHFYTDAEIKGFKARWRGSSVAATPRSR